MAEVVKARAQAHAKALVHRKAHGRAHVKAIANGKAHGWV